MRITTQTYFNTALNGIEQQRSNISQLTQELASGQAVNKPSDNPTAFANAQRLQANTQALDQLNTDNANLNNQLGLGSQTLSQALSVINNVRSIALQAANATTNTANRSALAKQVQSAKAQLINIANTKASNGAYLFGGSSGGVAPFAQQPNGTVVYRGDGASEQLHIAPNQSVQGLLSGQVFSDVRQGNGYASLSATAGNTGSGVAVLTGVTDVSNATSFRDSPASAAYAISFASGPSGLTYSVTSGSTGTVVSTGSFSNGMSLTVPNTGISLRFDGTPAAGDSFTLSPSHRQSIFDTLDQLTQALNSPQSTAAQHAQNAQKINAVLSNLDQSQTQILSLQSTVGVATQAIGHANNTNAAQQTNDKQVISSALDANIPQVLTALNEHKLALTAAMGAFGNLSKLSLFNYL